MKLDAHGRTIFLILLDPKYFVIFLEHRKKSNLHLRIIYVSLCHPNFQGFVPDSPPKPSRSGPSNYAACHLPSMEHIIIQFIIMDDTTAAAGT